MAERKKFKTSVRVITPEIAREMLKANPNNRPVTDQLVEFYASVMQRPGEWVVADPIMLSDKGEIIEGQHRLHAVIRAGVSVAFLIIEGFDREEVFAKTGIGRERKTPDHLGMRGHDNTKVLGGSLQFLFQHRAGRVPTSTGSGRRRASPTQLLELLDENPDMITSITTVPYVVRKVVSRSQAVFLHYLFAEKDRVLADAFMDDLAYGTRLRDNDPVYMLRRRLIEDRSAKARLSRLEVMALVIKAWNAERNGKPIKTLRWRSSGTKPEPFPEVL